MLASVRDNKLLFFMAVALRGEEFVLFATFAVAVSEDIL